MAAISGQNSFLRNYTAFQKRCFRAAPFLYLFHCACFVAEHICTIASFVLLMRYIILVSGFAGDAMHIGVDIFSDKTWLIGLIVICCIISFVSNVLCSMTLEALRVRYGRAAAQYYANKEHEGSSSIPRRVYSNQIQPIVMLSLDCCKSFSHIAMVLAFILLLLFVSPVIVLVVMLCLLCCVLLFGMKKNLRLASTQVHNGSPSKKEQEELLEFEGFYDISNGPLERRMNIYSATVQGIIPVVIIIAILVLYSVMPSVSISNALYAMVILLVVRQISSRSFALFQHMKRFAKQYKKVIAFYG